MIEPSNLSHLFCKELRHVEPSKLAKLAAIIDQAKGWTRLLEELTRPSNDNIRPTLYLSSDSINLIEQQVYCGKSPSLALLNYWSITGRRRPTVRDVLHYLRLCNLKWAEENICNSILGINRVEGYVIDEKYNFHDLNELLERIDSKCARYSFPSTYKTTSGFCHSSLIGEGRFSSVYKARVELERSALEDANDQLAIDAVSEPVAAKLLKSECNKEYLINEINLMRKINNENILKLLGVAIGKSQVGCSSYICLIYPYMQNGSLLDCLSSGVKTQDRRFLTWVERFHIATKIATGIVFLHRSFEVPIIHRDIKTANIFMDLDLNPKIGDFTLIRQLYQDTQFSQNIIGTSVYMPPEAFRGDLSIKFDTFSFGIVLLELLTGLKPFNDDLNEDILTYINEHLADLTEDAEEDAKDKFLFSVLDKKAGEWRDECAKMMFNVALQATESRKKLRPLLAEILPTFQEMSQKISSS